MKTYVLTLSKNFKDGTPTNFEQKFLSGKKIHTIRGNYDFWRKRIVEVQKGRAVISVRQWSGVPYKSKQEEILQLTHEHGVGFEKIVMQKMEEGFYTLEIEGNEPYYCIDDVANNDGLTWPQFRDWFFGTKEEHLYEGIIIHFTNFRYKK